MIRPRRLACLMDSLAALAAPAQPSPVPVRIAAGVVLILVVSRV